MGHFWFPSVWKRRSNVPLKRGVLCIYTTRGLKTHSAGTHLGTVQVLVFLQKFIRLLYCHFIVAIIKVIWGKQKEAVI